MIKNILVGVDGSDHARTATRYAQWFAKRFDARVLGLHVIDIVSVEGPFFHDISGSLGFEPYLDFTSKVRDALAERVYAGADPAGADVPTHDLDEFYLVASWFRRRPEEKQRAHPVHL